MPWQLNYLSDSTVIETVYTGIVTASELERAVQANHSASQTHGAVRFLADCSTMEGGHSLIDLYFLAGSVLQLSAGMQFKEAVILPQGVSREKVQFWQTTCANRGLTVRAFEDRASALAWLLG